MNMYVVLVFLVVLVQVLDDRGSTDRRLMIA